MTQQQIQDLSYLNQETLKQVDQSQRDAAIAARERDQANKASFDELLDKATKVLSNHEKAAPLKEAKALEKFDKAFNDNSEPLSKSKEEIEEVSSKETVEAKKEEPIKESTKEIEQESDSLDTPKLKEIFERLNKADQKQTEVRKKIQEVNKISEEEKALVEKAKKIEALKNDPLNLLKELGLDLNQLNQKVATQRTKSPEMLELEAQVAEMRQMLQDRSIKETQEKYESENAKHLAKIESIAKDKYEVIASLGLHKQVDTYMRQVYAETGKIPSYEQACEIIEDNYLTQIEKLKGSKKLLNKLGVNKQEEEAPKVSKSLNNAMNQSTQVEWKAQTESERLARAMQILSGQIK